MERIIRVTGRGKIAVRPDTIRLNISATKVCKEYGDAVKASAEDTGILRKTMESAGLNPKDLKTTHFKIDSEYKYYYDENNNRQSKFVGYRYTHNLYIQFPNDNQQLGQVLYALAHCDVEVEFSIRHTVKDPEKVKNQLLEKAITDSRIKAEVLSKSAGVTLGEVQTIDYSWEEMEIYTRSRNTFRNRMHRLAGNPRSYDIDIEADDIDVEDTVTVVWGIG